jgi:hypothetical protein
VTARDRKSKSLPLINADDTDLKEQLGSLTAPIYADESGSGKLPKLEEQNLETRRNGGSGGVA